MSSATTSSSWTRVGIMGWRRSIRTFHSSHWLLVYLVDFLPDPGSPRTTWCACSSCRPINAAHPARQEGCFSNARSTASTNGTSPFYLAGGHEKEGGLLGFAPQLIGCQFHVLAHPLLAILRGEYHMCRRSLSCMASNNPQDKTWNRLSWRHASDNGFDDGCLSEEVDGHKKDGDSDDCLHVSVSGIRRVSSCGVPVVKIA